MDLIGIAVDRIVIHEVFGRDEHNDVIAPKRGPGLTKFDAAAMRTFIKRIVDAVGGDSKAVEMEIKRQGENDLPKLFDRLADQDDDEFVTNSYGVAKELAKAQTRRNLPGGIVVVFTGKSGANRDKFIGVFKADTHSGYQKEENPETNYISLNYVEELLLTPNSKLYKTGVFFQRQGAAAPTDDLNAKWLVMVADTQVGSQPGKAAALYFYDSFLGCGYLETSALTTQSFHTQTKKFLKLLAIPEPDKSDLYNALHTYLKTDTSDTIGVSDFADKYLRDEGDRERYIEYMIASGMPTTTFTRDLKHVVSNLSNRYWSFGNKVKITAPSGDLLEIKEFDGEQDGSGNIQKWTEIIIKDKVSGQE